MLPKDTDTDPSTPESLRPGDTDPGIGPPTEPNQPVSAGVSSGVPVKAPVGQRKDSVELLLDGMPAQQPQKPRTVPQSAGESSAAYHVEHSVRPAHTSPDDMPKVVVQRAPQRATVLVDRSKLDAVIAAADRRAQQTHAGPPEGLPLALRIAIAVVAGLAVVLAIFLIARPSTETPTATSAPATPPSGSARPRVPPSALAPSAPPAPVLPPALSASAPPTVDSSGPSLATSASTAKPRPRPLGAAPSASGELGEFRTTFH